MAGSMAPTARCSAPVNSKGGVNATMGGGDRRGSASGRLAGNGGSGQLERQCDRCILQRPLDRAARLSSDWSCPEIAVEDAS